MNPSKSQYPSSNHWNGQQHRSSSGNYVNSSSSSYDPAAQHYSTGDPNAPYAPNYYMASNETYLPGGTSSSSSVNTHHHRYSQSIATGLPIHAPQQSQHYPSHSHSHHSPTSPTAHTHGHSHNHSVSHPYEQPYVQSSSYPSQGRARSHSHSQMSPYESAMPPQSHYPPQVPLSPSTSMTHYAASPSRPFACDLCSLSFNRQHDLKRHRETHTGEKPYLCNGGCGKTFTRKDALKRHQLVKGCGKVDETWS
ncbi:hypothetical protein BT96DRAFT_911866 [Gymnopus androsaceus JB14]|uniref:C2H2-type domain-containing protein n=1 Tax=Gymnopus androsaceus JB14 TaxID=1447944 RepID=A0A6A4IRA3_9AGAR|nr:hypothetical protein BT96DRAFT_911866 [Gymnopus androsaceus JB14]